MYTYICTNIYMYVCIYTYVNIYIYTYAEHTGAEDPAVRPLPASLHFLYNFQAKS